MGYYVGWVGRFSMGKGERGKIFSPSIVILIFNLQPWELFLSRYSLALLIARGLFAIVARALRTVLGTHVLLYVGKIQNRHPHADINSHKCKWKC